MNIILSGIINDSTTSISTLHLYRGKMKKLIIAFYPFMLLITFVLTSTSIYAADVSEYFPVWLNDGDTCKTEWYGVSNTPGQPPSVNTVT